MKEKVLLTGGSGFLGTYIKRLLNKQGSYSVYAPGHNQLNLTRYSEALKACKGINTVIHAAGLVLSRIEQQKRPAEVLFQNLASSLNIAEAAAKSGVKKIIFVSSMTAYGQSVKSPLKEGMLWQDKPLMSNLPYGVAKRVMDTLSFSYKAQYGIKASCLVLSALYGPEDKFNLAPPPLVASIIKQVYNAKATGQKEIRGGNNGEQGVDLLYVEDAAEAISRVLKIPNLPELINIGTGKSVTIGEVFALAAKNLNYNGRIVWQSNKNSPGSRYLDVSLIQKNLGWRPKINLQQGMKLTIEWYLKRIK